MGAGVVAGLGVAAGTWLESLGSHPVLLAGAVLIGLGIRGLVELRAAPAAADPALLRLSRWRTFATFAGLTMVNPATVIYFLALATALPVSERWGVAHGPFILGVALASLSWQLALARPGRSCGCGSRRWVRRW